MDHWPRPESMLLAGFTAPEMEAWDSATEAARAFFKLPEEHPSEQAEIAAAFHVIQRALLARPTRRRFHELDGTRPPEGAP